MTQLVAVVDVYELIIRRTALQVGHHAYLGLYVDTLCIHAVCMYISAGAVPQIRAPADVPCGLPLRAHQL